MRCLLAICLCIAAIAAPSAGADTTVSAERTAPSIQYTIIVTGGELLSGAFPDSHTHFVTSTLQPLGLRCVGSVCVDDQAEDIFGALRFATQKAPLVLVTGGLGPTDNDRTRETLAEFTGIPLREHPDVLQAMERRLRTSRDSLRDNLRRQTLVPSRGRYLENANGTAVGLVFEQEKATVVALPGPPRELQPMVREQLVPYLVRRYGVRSPGCSVTLRFVGLGQSQVDQTLEDHIALPPDVMVSSGFEAGRVDFTFSLPGDTQQDHEKLQQLKAGLVRHLGDYVYAEDGETSLENRVLELLGGRGATLTVVDVGTGGLLASGLNGCSGGANTLTGAFLAPTADDVRRLLGVGEDQWSDCVSDSQRAELLAKTAAERVGSSCAVAVGQLSEKGADGRPSVMVALRLPVTSCPTAQVHLRDASPTARARLATEALNLLRRQLENSRQGI